MRKQPLPQPIYNEYAWGGYLIWKLPDYRVYIDGRADVYGDAFLEEFLKTHDGIGDWRAPLDRHAIRTVMIDPNAPLASLLKQDAAWNKVFEDQQAVIFVNTEALSVVMNSLSVSRINEPRQGRHTIAHVVRRG